MRNLGLKIALWLTVLLPINGFALGLGDIEVNSFLNQPLDAKIEVLSARPGEIDDLLVSLASREAFTRAGLERPRHLSELKFSVVKDEAGETAVIMVTTRSAIKEPFLNFLIEADWSKGRLLREFTVLLDPPFYAEQPAATETFSESSPPEPIDEVSATESDQIVGAGVDTSSDGAATGSTVTEPIALSQDSSSGDSSDTPLSSPPSSSEYVADDSQNIIQGDVLVVKGDTLWGIASRYKDDDHSMAQVMLAFQRTNPEAFNNGNINNMKVAAVLRAPSADELDALDKRAAFAETLVQNGLWDEYVARVTGVSPAIGGSSGDSESSGQDDSASQGELSLLLPGEGDSSSTGTGDSADIDRLRTKLAMAEEELEASRVENTDLESRISELQARLSKVEELQKMVEIEDDSLAQLQAEQNADQNTGVSEDITAEEPAVELTAGDDAVAETIKADEEALLEELLAEEAAAQAEEQVALQQDTMTDDGESETTVSDDVVDSMVEEPVVTEPSNEQMIDEDTETATVTPPPAPVIITESAASGSSTMLDGILPQSVTDMLPSMGGVLGNPIILAAVGGVIVLLLVLVIIKRRKEAQDDDLGIDGSTETDLFVGDDDEEMTPIHLADAEDPVETDIKIPSSEDMTHGGLPVEDEDGFAATAIISAVDMPEPEAAPASAAEQDDVLNEVDVYLAYGLYDNAEDLLKSSLVENPDRAEYRSKLLDTYFATKKSDAFVEEAQKLKGMGELGASYWNRVQVMGYELAPDNALFSDAKDSGLSAADLEIAKPQEADFDLGASSEDDTNFSSTDFNLGEGEATEEFNAAALLGKAEELESTQQISAAADDEVDDLLELPDDIGAELEFSMDDELPTDLGLPDGDAELADDDIELLADLDLGDLDDGMPVDDAVAAADDDALALDFDIDDDDSDDDLILDDALEMTPPGEDRDIAKTEIITPNYEDTAIVSIEDEEQVAAEENEDDIDLGMEDTALKDTDKHIEETGEFHLDIEDDAEDISIIDFGGDDFVEPTGALSAVSDADMDDDFVLDDEDSEESSTGTFAPGDFDEPTAAIDSLANIDNMDDLMLPDDVDEVSTKLDLARAFIDMGDTEGARGSLDEVMSEGSAEQKAEAKTLLDQI